MGRPESLSVKKRKAVQRGGSPMDAYEPTPDPTRLTLECPCCGGDGAEADADGMFTDGQALICGCPGFVHIDDIDEPLAFIAISDDVECEAGHD